MPPIEEAHAINRKRIADLREELKSVPWDSKKLTLEIGCGHGHFLAAYTQANPEEHCVAIDIIKKRLEKTLRKTERNGSTNVSCLRASDLHFFAALPDTVRFNHRVFILFPDPWPKRKHWKNRLIQPPFLDTLARFTAPGTELCFRTDHGPYFKAAREVVAAHSEWVLQPDVAWPFEQESIFEARAAGYQSWIASRI